MHFYNHIDLKACLLLNNNLGQIIQISISSKCLWALLKKVWNFFGAKKCHYVHAKACPGSVLRISMLYLCGLVNNRVKAEFCKLKIHCLKGDSYQKKGYHCPSELRRDGGHFCTWRNFRVAWIVPQLLHMWNSSLTLEFSAEKDDIQQCLLGSAS